MSWRSELERYEREHLSKKSAIYRANAPSHLRRIGEHANKSFKKLKLKDFESFFASRKLSKASIKTIYAYTKACVRWLNGRETPRGFPALDEIATVTFEDTLAVKKVSQLLTDDEFARLCGGLSKRDEVIVRLVRATGARVGEILKLEREDVVWETVDGQEVCMLSLVDTKTKAPRMPIVFHQKAADLLREYMLQTVGDLLFPAARGGGSITTNSFWVTLDRTKKTVGIKKTVNGKLLRHMFASNEAAKLPSAQRDTQMGWRTDMWRRYTHLTAQDRIRTALDLGVGVGRPVVAEDRGAKLENQLFQMDRFTGALLEVVRHLVSKGDEDAQAFLEVAENAYKQVIAGGE